MTYLVLGSTSFAGASLVEYLLQKGEKVLGVSRSAEYPEVMQPYAKNINKKAFAFYQYDVNNNIPEIISLIESKKPAYIIDLAGQGMVAESWNDPSQWYQTNILSKVKLHHMLKNCDFLERYVRVSTPEVYGDSLAPMKESHIMNPSTPYAVSHAAIDMSLMAFHKQFQFPVTLTRFANFYGPHQQLYRIIPRAIIYGLLGKKLPLHGGGTSERMFIYAHDVAHGIYKAMHQGRSGETYHFTTKPLISIRALIEKICNTMQINIDSFVQIADERPGKDNKYEMDATKSMQELDWKPEYTLERGLERTIDWVKKNIEDIQFLPLHYIHKP